MNKWKKLAIGLLVLAIPVLAYASFVGDVAKWNATVDGYDWDFGRDISVGRNLVVTGSITGASLSGGDPWTGDNGEIISNANTDGVIDITFNEATAELGDLQLIGSGTSPADNDSLLLSFYSYNDNATAAKFEYASLDFEVDDVTSTSYDSTLFINLMQAQTAATPVEVLELSPGLLEWTSRNTGASLGDIRLVSDSSSPADDDSAFLKFYGEDTNSSSINFVLLDFEADDVSSDSYDSTFRIALMTNQTGTTPVNEFEFTGASLAPSADEGWDVGTTTNRIRDLHLGGASTWEGDAVALTSPTVTFSAANRGLVVLTSDANQTGIYPTGGALYQRLLVLSGAGSNTMQFDDGTSMSLGANKTLTEGQNDTLELICLSADGDEWALVSDGSGN